MYFNLVLFSICIVVKFASCGGVDDDIDKLPAAAKKELYDRIARRIFNEVKTKQLANHSEVLVTKEQLQAQDEYVKKLLDEEQKKLRKSFSNNYTLTTTSSKNLEKSDGTAVTTPLSVKKDEKQLKNQAVDIAVQASEKKNLRQEKAFIDMTKRSSRGISEPEGREMESVTKEKLEEQRDNTKGIENIPNENENNASAIKVTGAVPDAILESTTEIIHDKNQVGVNIAQENDSKRKSKLSTKHELGYTPAPEQKSEVNDTKVTDNNSDSSKIQAASVKIKNINRRSFGMGNDYSEIKELEPDFTAFTEKNDGEPTEANILFERKTEYYPGASSSDANQDILTENNPDPTAKAPQDIGFDKNFEEGKITQMDLPLNDEKNATKEEVHQFRSEDLDGEHVVDYVNISLMSSTDKSELVSVSVEPQYDISKKDLEYASFTETSVKTSEKHLEIVKNGSIVKNTGDTNGAVETEKGISINSNVGAKLKYVASTNINIDVTTEKQQNANLNVDSENKNVDKSNVNFENNLKGMTTLKPFTPIVIEVTTKMSKQLKNFTPTIIEASLGQNKPKILKPRAENIIGTSTVNNNSEPYFVFEAPGNKNIFQPQIVTQESPVTSPEDSKTVLIEAAEVPIEVPVHNYDPKNAYFNPSKYYEVGSNENIPKVHIFHSSNIESANAKGNNVKIIANDKKYMFGFNLGGEPYSFESVSNYEPPREVPVHIYDPSNAYYNPSKFFGTGPIDKATIQVYPQELKPSSKINTKLINVDVASGNNNDIIFQKFDLKYTPAPKQKHIPNDDYILNFLKKKYRTPNKVYFKPSQGKKKILFKDISDKDFVVIQDIFGKNIKFGKNEEYNQIVGSNFVIDTLFNTHKQTRIPRRKKKSTQGKSEFNKLIGKYVKGLAHSSSEGNADDADDSFVIIPSKTKNKKASQQTEIKFLKDALNKIFEKSSRVTNNKQEKRKLSKNKKRSSDDDTMLRDDDDIALDYFERDLIDDKTFYDSLPFAEDKNEMGELPVWVDTEEVTRDVAYNPVVRNEKAEISEVTGSPLEAEALSMFRKLKEYLILDAKKESRNPYILSTTFKPDYKNIASKLEKLKAHWLPDVKSDASAEAKEACAPKESVNSYLNVLQDMINVNNEALENFDWLGTTVDIEASLVKLAELSQMYLDGRELKPTDYQVFKFFVYLHKMTDETIRHRAICLQNSPKDVYRYEDNGDQLIIAPKDASVKSKEDQNVLNTKTLLNEYLFNLFKLKRTGEYAEEERSDIRHLYEFVTALKEYLFELHMAVKNIALVTEYASQSWYRDLKSIYLKSAKRKQLLSVLLHITFIRVLDMIEVALLDGVDKNYVKFIVEHVEDFEKILEKTEFIKNIMIEIAKENT